MCSWFKSGRASEKPEIETLQLASKNLKDLIRSAESINEKKLEHVIEENKNVDYSTKLSQNQELEKQRSELEGKFNAKIDDLKFKIQLEREEMRKQRTRLRDENDEVLEKLRLEHAREISELKKSQAEAIREKEYEFEQLFSSMLTLQEECRIQLDKHRGSEALRSPTLAVCCPTEDLKRLDIKTVEGEKEIEAKIEGEDADRNDDSDDYIQWAID